jgi:DNA primase
MIDMDAIRSAYPLPAVAAKIVALRPAGKEWVACCPFHSDRSPSFTIFDGGRRFHCFGCGASGDVLDFVQRAFGIGLRDAATMLSGGTLPINPIALRQAPQPPREDRSGEARAIWERTQEAVGSPAEAYLRFRGIMPPYPPDIRFLGLPCDNLGPLPALVAAVRNVAGDVTGIQRIWLARDGRGKADVAKPKRSFGTVKGGAIRLGKLDGSGAVTVCEGPEDGMSLLEMLGGPVWVAAGASMLPGMLFPPEVRAVTIAADNDAAGEREAAKACAAFADRGLRVRIIHPLPGFKDFNDELQGGAVMASNPNLRQRLKSAAEVIGEGPRPLYRELPPAPAFPVDALGGVLGPAAKAIEAVIQCPLACAANSVLAVASLAAQGRANVVLPIGEGKSAPLSLFLLTVLDSGERKSSADAMALKPVHHAERDLVETRAGEQLAYETERAAHEANAKHLTAKHKADRAALKAALLELGPAPQPPLLAVLAPSGDQTMEGLFRIYERGRPSLAMLCDDAASFLGGHSMKAEQKSQTTANLCRAWDGSKLERIRGGDGVTVLYDRRLAMHLMVQSGVAADFLSDPRLADQGLLARFLVSAPAGRAGTRFRDDAVYQDASRSAARDLEPYNRAIGHLLRQPVHWKNESDRTAGVEMDSLHFTPEARALYVDFGNAIETELGPKASLAGMRAFASKLPENAARIAGILTLIANPQAGQVDAGDLADAIELAKYYLAEAARIVASGAIDPELRQAETLRDWLVGQKGDVIPHRTIYQFGPGSIRTAAKARAAMTILAEHGWAKPMAGGAIIGGVSHREAWEICRC